MGKQKAKIFIVLSFITLFITVVGLFWCSNYARTHEPRTSTPQYGRGIDINKPEDVKQQEKRMMVVYVVTGGCIISLWFLSYSRKKKMIEKRKQLERQRHMKK